MVEDGKTGVVGDSPGADRLTANRREDCADEQRICESDIFGGDIQLPQHACPFAWDVAASRRGSVESGHSTGGRDGQKQDRDVPMCDKMR